MGRATNWFRGLFCPKKLDPALLASKLSKEKRRWSFVKSYREKDTGPINDTANVPNEYDKSEESQTTLSDGVVYSNKCAIAVAATSAVMPEAAVATAQADAPVVKLTSIGRSVGNSVAYVSGSCVGFREESAAIRIQAAFRGCLAKRALRALKGLVRLQAIVRGHIERKRTTKWLRQMQAMLQAQKIARAMRDQISNSSNLNCKPSQFHQHKSGSKSNFINIGDQDRASSGLGQSDGWLDERSADHGTPNGEHSYRNFEMNTGKSRITPGRRRNLFQSSNYDLSPNKLISQSFTTSKDSTNHHIFPSPLGHCEVQSPSRLKLVHHEVEECSFWTTNNSPQFFCASLRCCDGSRRSPFIPRKSDGSRSFLSGDSDYPSYMACTESSKAKVRSLSAPKLRLQYERSSSAKKCSVGLFESSAPRMCTLHSNFTNKTYPGSGRLDKMGIPISYTY